MKKHGLSDAEYQLWKVLTQGIQKLRKDDVVVPIPPHPKKRVAPKDAPLLLAQHIVNPADRPKPSLSVFSLTRKELRHIEHQATIDLHGMTRAHAREALLHFVARAYEEGKTMVLVITGKGTPTGSGAIYQELPGWLTTYPLSAFVRGLSPAQQKHGGQGASYLFLKKKC